MIVNVEDIGTLEFPDGTSQEVIQKTIKGLVAQKKAKPKKYSDIEVVDDFLFTLANVKDIYMEEVEAGQRAVGKALEEPTGRSVIGGFIGALRYGAAPAEAIAGGLVGTPTERTLKEIGVPDKPAEFAGEMAKTAAYFVPYAKLVQSAVVGKAALAKAKEIEKGVKIIEKQKKPLKFPEKLPDEVIKDAVEPISDANKKILKEAVIDDVVDTLKTPISKKWKPHEAKRITQEIVDYIVANPDEILKVAKKYKLSPQELAAQIKETMTLAGRDLGKMGRLAKEIRQKFQTPYMKKLSKYMDEMVPDVTAMDKFGKAFTTVENVRRAALVSQFVTTFRNIASQGGRVTLGTIHDAFEGAATAYLKSAGEGTFKSVTSTLKGFGEGLDLMVASLHRMKAKDRAKLVSILDSMNGLDAKAKMFTTPIHDVVLSSAIAKRLNTFNTMQEYFFRNISFEARLRQLARKAGLDFKKLNPEDLPESMLTEAAEYALDMTFAAMPKSKFAKDWVKAMSHPIMTALINPFPRFLYGNALPFLKRYSPLGFLEAAKPSVVADIVSGNPEKFTKAITEASLGTLMLNLASYVRNSEFRGERWYQIKVGEKDVDTRAYAPFSTYLFLAESIQHPERIKPSDFGMALLSLNRIGGTGLVLADIIRGRNFATTIHTMKRLGGAYLSGFTVPARTIKDLYTAVDPEEAIIRDVRGNEFWGPTMANIPELSQKLPKRRTPLKVGDIRTEHPIWRQFSGLSVMTKTALQQEVDEVQLNYKRIYPGTGDAAGDRKVSEIMAPKLEQSFSILLEKTNYSQLDNITKRIILGEMFRDAKKEARSYLIQTDPDLALKIRIEDIPEDYMKLLKSRGIL